LICNLTILTPAAALCFAVVIKSHVTRFGVLILLLFELGAWFLQRSDVEFAVDASNQDVKVCTASGAMD